MALAKTALTSGPLVFLSVNAKRATNSAASFFTASSFKDLLINIKLVNPGMEEASFNIFFFSIAVFAFPIWSSKRSKRCAFVFWAFKLSEKAKMEMINKSSLLFI